MQQRVQLKYINPALQMGMVSWRKACIFKMCRIGCDYASALIADSLFRIGDTFCVHACRHVRVSCSA
jgi:hypothetical protein